MDVQCYAQRLLNPFRGAAKYIRFQSAEAVSLDGVTRDICVASDEVRAEFETAARSLALVVEQHHRFYPHVINEPAIQAARVKAMTRKNQPRDEA
jgi:hypothetical protein